MDKAYTALCVSCCVALLIYWIWSLSALRPNWSPKAQKWCKLKGDCDVIMYVLHVRGKKLIYAHLMDFRPQYDYVYLSSDLHEESVTMFSRITIPCDPPSLLKKPSFL